MARVVCRDCAYSDEADDLVAASDLAERHERKEVGHDVQVERVATDGGLRTCAADWCESTDLEGYDYCREHKLLRDRSGDGPQPRTDGGVQETTADYPDAAVEHSSEVAHCKDCDRNWRGGGCREVGAAHAAQYDHRVRYLDEVVFEGTVEDDAEVVTDGGDPIPPRVRPHTGLVLLWLLVVLGAVGIAALVVMLA